MTYDIFINFSLDDQKIAKNLSAYLEQNGIRCFVADRDILKSVPYPQELNNYHFVEL